MVGKEGSAKYERLKKYIPEITEWVRQGVTKRDIAEKLQIGQKTLYTWMDKYPEFKEAFAIGLELNLDDVEASLYKSTKWQTVNETWYDENNKQIKKFVKEIAPNQRAIEYTLNNRRPGTWKSDTQAIDISMSERMREKLSGLKIDDLVSLANMQIDDVANEEQTDTPIKE